MNKKPRRSREYVDRFVGLPHWMLISPAWRSLSGNAVKLLVDLWKRHNGVNNGEITYSVREAEGIGLASSTAARSFAELIEKGFLVITRASAFTVKTHDARCWRLTAERSGHERATKDFMLWTPSEIQKPVPRAGHTVPQVGPSHSNRNNIAANGAADETVPGQIRSKTVPPAGHL